MTSDQLHLTQRLLTIYSNLFIKCICRYTSSILCNIFFGVIFLTPTWNASFTKTCHIIISSKTWWEPKNIIFPPLQAMRHGNRRKNKRNGVSFSIKYILLHFSRYPQSKNGIDMSIYIYLSVVHVAHKHLHTLSTNYKYSCLIPLAY